ncbi:Gfo/Idh/MocA family oxidoreductase [Isoptericola sp. NEAU-Y5]|uniref:Gfo/Idh/MocA family oxidoreductase n=1 Tax=Isoptericola luteus TaxID=2879484 RepID=A0ABS7ZB73_9MICO|nr:Gfo/Idh/MocA family oxidoreductase [Isoptericola sp. NEAU-Y5]MCA5892293.1 Gfo/Idh/MocA family oxidoreductase [Isoptericola sp. NEAU-Y5]
MTTTTSTWIDDSDRKALPRIAVVGVHSHGASHVRRVLELQRTSRAVLAAVVDPHEPGPEHEAHAAGTPWFPTLGDLISAPGAPVDVVVLSTPIPTHLPLARAAMEAGMDVLLEKPTTASLAEHTELVAVAERTGRRCQVGFQTFGSQALPAAADLVARGEIGEVTGIGAVGAWVRTASYWARAPWAGRRRLDGRDVVDGVVTNPLAHAVATALRLGGATRAEDVAWVDTDLYRANPIESDDTSSVRVAGADGRRYGFGLTLCAAERTPARVLMLGTAGELVLEYEHDRLLLRTDRVSIDKTYGRTPLLEDLLAARTAPAERPLLCDVRDTGAFMRVLEAVRTGPDPRPVGDEHVTWAGDAGDRHPVVTDVARWCEDVARTQRTFTELGAPWTV